MVEVLEVLEVLEGARAREKVIPRPGDGLGNCEALATIICEALL
jgi:hypothetical protein